MYLSELEIFGFKSFALKTKLKFAEGLSAVVGPNGCGKTNVVDAIRWVLGEKKASTLRSDIMENVIFNGNKDRKPLGMAEVSISFNNNKGILPSDYNEVEITRRLYRNGESEYLINKSICRLKDILNLFMDTGIGSDTYSVIELKMIEQILSGKVDDRRAMFEEAAGIKKYKARRKETSRKLEIINQDMTRLNDLLLEVRKNVNSLSRQASKTKRYNQLLNELREIEIHSLAIDLKNYNFKFNEIITNLDILNNNNILLSKNYDDKTIEIQNYKKDIADLEIELAEISLSENNIINIINDNKKEIAISNEKINSNLNTIQRLENEINESKFQNENLNINIKDTKNNLDILDNEIKDITQQKISISEQFTISNSKIKTIRDNFATANSNLNTLKIKIDNINNNINRNRDKEKQILNKIKQNENEVNNINHQSIKIEEDIIQLITQKEQNDFNIVNAEQELNNASEQKTIIENNINDIKLNINQLKQNKNSKKATLDFLNSLVDNTEVSKFLNNDKNWNTSKDKVILAESLGIDDKFATALIAALGESAHSFVVDTIEDAQQAITSLRKAQKGKSGFIILDKIPIIDSPGNIEINDNCFGWLSELITADNKLKSVVRGLTGRTAVVSDRLIAEELINTKICDTAVTLDGELINKIGYIYGGSISQKEGQWVGKNQKINDLKDDINNFNLLIEEQDNQLKLLQEELQLIDIQSLNDKLKKYQQEVVNITRSIDILSLKKESLSNNVNMFETMKIDLNNQLNDLNLDNEKLLLQKSDFENEFDNAKLNSESLKIELNEIEISNNTISKSLREIELKELTTNNNINNLNNQLINYNNLISNNIQKTQIKEKEINNLDIHIKELELSIAKLSQSLEEYDIKLNELLNKKQIINEQLSILKNNTEATEIENLDIRNSIDNLNKNILNLEISKTQVETASNNIIQKLNDEYQLTPDNIELPNEDEFNIAEAKAQIVDLKNKLNQLGSVNFMALEEFETQSERLEFYEKQLTDLTDSEKILTQTINEINANAEQQFKDTFVKIRENFKDLFQKLFGPDGEAELELANDNLLETDIIITAKPPNKKPHSIEMLSGGEKTLTAIALLFAIYLVKPSPFCILDEVDAPLDDKNIDKFINMIKEFSIDTQFLIVTHNKKTMEAANTLYGVTMQEAGVSKVVSVKIKQDDEAAA